MICNELLKQLPEKPGIYLMHDKEGNIIYVGKAKSLKKRVSQYFTVQKDREPKITEMISNIDSFKWIVTDTELDALIEECRFIKEIGPRYNRQMKHTHSYVYIKVTAEQYPKLTMVNSETDDALQYFGPFNSPRLVDLAIRYLNDFYLMRKCSNPAMAKGNVNCLHWKLGTCLGICLSKEGAKEYRARIDGLRTLLSGKDGKAVRELAEKYKAAVQSLEFEKAAKYHDYYQGLQHVVGKQRLARASRKQRNIIAAERVDAEHIKLFMIKGNKLLYRGLFELAELNSSDTISVLLREVRAGFTREFDICEVSEYDIHEAQIIYTYLRRNKERIRCFWVPSTRLSGEASMLNGTLSNIISRINSI